MKKSWEKTKKLVQNGSVTPLYVSNVVSIDVDMAECLMGDWMELLKYEANKDLDEKYIENKDAIQKEERFEDIDKL